MVVESLSRHDSLIICKLVLVSAGPLRTGARVFAVAFQTLYLIHLKKEETFVMQAMPASVWLPAACLAIPLSRHRWR